MSKFLASAAHHQEQWASNYCVPACTSIVLSRLGRHVPQADVCAAWHGDRRGFPLEQAEQVLGGTHHTLDPDAAGNYRWMQRQLQSSHWIVASVFAEKLMQLVQAMSPPPVSRFGDLWHGEPGALHTVVLTGVIDRRFYYLDPFYQASGQPFSLSRRDFARAFTGYLIEVPLR